MPRASLMAPAAITGTFTASTTCGTSAKVPTWRREIVGQEHAAMAAGLDALRDHGIAAVGFQPARLLDRGRRTQHQAAGSLHALAQRGSGKPKWKLTTSGFNSSTTAQNAASNGVRLLDGTGAAGSMPSSS